MSPPEQDREMHERFREAETAAQRLAAEGRLLESGWSRLKELWLSPETSPEQVAMLRLAFFAGAQHTWTSVLALMGDDSASDMERVGQVAAELEAFRKEWAREGAAN